MKCLCFLSLFGITLCQVFGQSMMERNTWYFGFNFGLDFKSGSPNPLYNGQITTAEGMASISDKDGNLLFYTNGENIWNRKHQLMSWGNGLRGSALSTQSSLIVKQPGSETRYFVFTTSTNSIVGLHYSIVDVSYLNGDGHVLQRNKFIYSPCDQKLAGITHASGNKIWILTHVAKSNKIRTYLLDSNGFDTSYYVESSGIISTDSLLSSKGVAEFSADGKKAVFVYGGTSKIELYDFNQHTGQLLNPQVITMPVSSTFDDIYYACFSPSSKFLYVSGSKLFQINTSLSSLAEITSSIKVVSNAAHAAIQTGPDYRLYIARYSIRRLSVIQNPDAEFPSCRYIDTGVVFSSSYRVERGLPNFVKHPEFDVSVSSRCLNDSVLFSFATSNSDSLKIEFGDSSFSLLRQNINTAKHKYNNSGFYDVRITFFRNSMYVSQLHRIYIRENPKVSLGDDTTVCYPEFQIVPTVASGLSYLWSNGSVLKMPKFYSDTLVWLRVFDGYCYAYDTVNVKVLEKPFDVYLGRDTIMCQGDKLLLDAGVTDANYLWNNGSEDISIYATQSNTYWVRVTKNQYRCAVYDTVRVSFYPRPKINLGEDEEICQGDSVYFDLTRFGYISAWWQDGQNSFKYTIKTAGDYWVTVRDQLCHNTDTIHVKIIESDNKLQSQYLLCRDDSVKIEMSSAISKVLWDDGDTSLVKIFSSPAMRYFTYSKGGCVFIDSLELALFEFPNNPLGRDTFLCYQVPLSISANISHVNFMWNTEETSRSINVIHPGIYSVQLSNKCGTMIDSIEVDDCECIFEVPTAFSPNSDNLNDYFRAIGCEPKYFNMKIFSRWGELVFEANSFEQAWDGKFNSKEATDNTYIWIIEYSSNRMSRRPNKIQRGTVTILK